LRRVLARGDLDRALSQLDVALVRHLDLHLTPRPTLVISERFVVAQKASALAKAVSTNAIAALCASCSSRAQMVSSAVRGRVTFTVKKLIAVSRIGLVAVAFAWLTDSDYLPTVSAPDQSRPHCPSYSTGPLLSREQFQIRPGHQRLDPLVNLIGLAGVLAARGEDELGHRPR
jgi:hypothetical protein